MTTISGPRNLQAIRTRKERLLINRKVFGELPPPALKTRKGAPDNAAAAQATLHLFWTGGAVKIVGVSDDLRAVAQCEAALQSELRGEASANRSQPYYLDVTHPEANKGGVVQFLSKRLQIAPEAIATIGDMPNDVTMFEESGLSIAMGNASAEVQAQANFFTLSNEEGGFAHATDKFVRPRAKSVATF